MEKRLLILNANYHDIPMIQAAKNLGYYTISSGLIRHPEHDMTDLYVPANFMDKDEMVRVAMDNNVDAVITSCNDSAYINSCYVAEKLHLGGHDSYETAKDLHYKDRFKRIAKKIGVSSPHGASFSDEEEAIEFAQRIENHVIVKPIDSSHGRGMTQARTPKECVRAVRNAFDVSEKKVIVIEPFVEGQLHSASCFLINQKVVFSFIEEGYVYPDNPHAVLAAISPAFDHEQIREQLLCEIEKVAKYLHLVNGKVHTNFIVDVNGCVHILEMHRRSSGDMYPYFVEQSTGVNWAEWIVRAETSMDLSSFPISAKQHGYHMMHSVAPSKNGILSSISFSPDLYQYIRRMRILATPGYEITNYRFDTLAVLFYEFSSLEEARNTLSEMDHLIHLEYK